MRVRTVDTRGIEFNLTAKTKKGGFLKDAISIRRVFISRAFNPTFVRGFRARIRKNHGRNIFCAFAKLTVSKRVPHPANGSAEIASARLRETNKNVAPLLLL